MKKLLVAGAAMAALAAAGSAHAYPTVGLDTAPFINIVLGSGGAVTITDDTTQSPTYDGSDDTYISVTNNSGGTVNLLHLSANDDIFGFDGDGIDGYGGDGVAPVAGNPDTSGYGGPLGYFTNIVVSGSLETGDVNFFGGLANGSSTYFSLEEALTSATFSGGGGGITTGGVPEPTTWTMMLVGVAALGGMLRLAGRKARAAVTA